MKDGYVGEDPTLQIHELPDPLTFKLIKKLDNDPFNGKSCIALSSSPFPFWHLVVVNK